MEEKKEVEKGLYTIKEVSVMFGTSKQQVRKLLKVHNIGIVNISVSEDTRPTFRVTKEELERLRELIKVVGKI